MKKKELIRLDEEIASKLQAKFDEEVRLAREKAEKEEEANIVAWDNVKKHFAAMRAQEERNKPPTKAQKRKTMSTYLKNMAGYKHNQLKNKSFNDIQKLFDKAMKRVNTFVDMDTELVEGSEQKLEEDKEIAKLQRLIEVVPDKEEVAIDVIPLATKPPSIVYWKIHKEGKKSYYHIIRADRSSKMYLVFSHMLKSFDREDLETLYKLVKAKYGSTRLVKDLDLVLYGDLKTMFDLHVKDQVWKYQSDYIVLECKLYDSCGVHSLRKQNVHIHMLVEKRYPLTAPTITDMLNKKLKADHWNEIVNADGTKLQLLKRLRLLEDFLLLEKVEGDEYEEMDYTTSQLYDDVDIRMNEPVDTDKEFVKEEGTDAAMTNVQYVNENPEIIQVIEDAHVTLSIVPQKTEVLVTSSSHSSDLASKFLNFLDILHTDAESVSPMDVHVHHEVPCQQTPTLLTVPMSIISDSSLVFSIVIP
ncbi:hypothetical protein Tco_1088058 [Tanacetum coccineum]